MTRSLLPWAIAALLLPAAAGGAPAARAGDGGVAAAPVWEQELERETREQTRVIEQAKRAKTMGAVVATYANRVSREGTALNLFLLGRALYHNDDPAGARVQMKAALQQDERFWPAHLKLAQLAIELKNWTEAEAQVSRALGLKPDDLEALETAWRLAVQREDWDGARRRLEGYLSRSPGANEARQALALVHLERKDWASALREAQLVIQADPRSFGARFVKAVAQRNMGDLDGATRTLESLLAEQPQSMQVLDELRAIAVKRKDANALKSVLEKMLPLLPPEKQRLVAQWLEVLRKDPASAFAPKETASDAKTLKFSDLVAEAQVPDVVRRREALQQIYEAVAMGLVKQVPRSVVAHVLPDTEPDPKCRAYVVKVCALLGEAVLPMVALVLHDEDRGVRMLAADTLGETQNPVAVVYLLYPLLTGEFPEPLEFESMRAALVAVAGFDDMPPGKRVTTAAEVAASREAWRRWMISDASSPVKIAGIRRLVALKDASTEWYLFDFVKDPNFEVMREAYLGMRDALAREPRSPVEKKVFPTFPRVADADVTRMSMRSIQDRVAAWHATWVAEHRAWLEAKGK